jgi:voltage-gated potassium channel
MELIKSPIFIMLTLLGNGLIGLCGGIFYYLEVGTNPRLQHFIDAIWWSFATATTTGYGDITPVTMLGKVLGIFLMLMGTALFAMYTGLFAEVILNNSRKHSIRER